MNLNLSSPRSAHRSAFTALMVAALAFFYAASAAAATGAIASGAAELIETARNIFYVGAVVGFLFLLVSKWLMGGDLQRFANPALGLCIVCGLGAMATAIPGWFGFSGALLGL